MIITPETTTHSPAVKTSAEIASARAAAMAASMGAPIPNATESVPPDPDFSSEVEKLREENAQLMESALRARADFENTRKRLQRDKDDAVKFANAGLLEKMLPVFDSFELGLDEAAKHEAAAPIAKGFELVLKQMGDFLKEQGVEPIEALGQPFDPNLHQALGNLESEEYPEGVICLQVRKGYKLRERLLRPSMVFVSKERLGGVLDANAS